MMNANLIDGLPESEYRALPGLSGTEVAKILDNPADLKWSRENPTPSTPAMSIGTLVHAMVLGQQTNAVVSEYPDFRTNAAKAWRAEVEAEGLTVVTADTWERAETMRDAALANEAARALLDAPGHSEVTVTAEHKGAPLKGRIDRLPNEGALIDLKSAKDVSPDGMSRFIGQYDTTTQLAQYALMTGRESEPPIIIAVRNQGRPAVAVYRIADLTWQIALDATRRAWDIYAECVSTGIWPDPYAEGIGELELRAWDMDRLEDIDMEVSL